jgi:glutamate racemase
LYKLERIILDNRPIGIFDSGVGGLTVFKEIVREVPAESVIYFGDTLRFPYGPRDLLDVKNLAFRITKFLLQNDVKIIVVACNTSTAAALEPLQQSFSVPVVGVIEPGARAAARSTSRGVVGVIATRGTVESGAYEKALKDFNGKLEVYQAAAPKLVEYVEKNILKGRELKEDIVNYVEPLNKHDIDVLILGCTHFPLIEREIKDCCRQGTEVISSAVETAKDVRRILSEVDIEADKENMPERIFYQTGNSDKFLEIAKIFMGNGIGEVRKVNLDL